MTTKKNIVELTESIGTSRRIKAFPSCGNATNTTRGFDADILWDDLGPEYEAILSMTFEEREELLSGMKEIANEMRQIMKYKDKLINYLDEQLAEVQCSKNDSRAMGEVD
jgi:hypothetical protein